jgi:Domain of Unknown Function (DUF349)
MALLDIFRAQPGWKHADPEIRAHAVRQIEAQEQELLLSLAREDTDARVRLAAVRRLQAPEALLDILRAETDASVAQEVRGRLLERALHTTDASFGQAALELLTEARSLAQLAKSAHLPELREAAVRRLADPKALSSLARTSEDAHVRQAAVERLTDEASLLEIALKTEHRAAALGATEKLAELDSLRAVAARARHRAAARRAEARLQDLIPAIEPAVPAPPPIDDDEDEAARWEAAQAAERDRLARQERQATELADAQRARTDLVERLLNLFEGDLQAELSAARAAWNDLPPMASEDQSVFQERFDAALAACQARLENQAARAALRPQVEELCVEAESASQTPDLAAARQGWIALQPRWEELRAQGAGDGALNARFRAAHQALKAREATDRATLLQRQTANKVRLEELCQALEDLLAAPALSLKDADPRLKAAREALIEPGPLHSKAERDALLARLKRARGALYPRFQQAREDADWKRFASEGVRESLWQRLQTLQTEKNMETLDRELREVERLWRQAGPQKSGADTLGAGFAALRAELRTRADLFLAQQAAEQQANVEKKVALCVQAEGLASSTDWKTTVETLQKLQAEWTVIGAVPAAQSQALWRRFRKPCDEFFARRKADLGQRKQVWGQNLERKQALVAQVEQLQSSTDWDKSAADIKRLQAEWKAVGPVRPTQSDAIWKRFRAGCDAFFARYKQRDEIGRQEQLAERETLVAELEALAATEGDAPEGVAAKLQDLQVRWRQPRPGGGEVPSALEQRFVHARNAVPTRFPAAFAGTDLDPEANRQKRERLCDRIEALLAKTEAGTTAATSSVSLADQLRNALAANALGGKAVQEARGQALGEELKTLRAAWNRVGPVPSAAGAELQARFDRCASRLNEHLRNRHV